MSARARPSYVVRVRGLSQVRIRRCAHREALPLRPASPVALIRKRTQSRRVPGAASRPTPSTGRAGEAVFQAISKPRGARDVRGASRLYETRGGGSHGGRDRSNLRLQRSATPIVDEVVHRVCDAVRDPLLALNEAAYLETKRHQSSGHPELAEWRALAAPLGRMSDAELREKLEHSPSATRATSPGNFDPRVYKFASRAAAPLIGVAPVADADAAAPRQRVRPPRARRARRRRGAARARSASSPRRARSSSSRRTSRTSTRSSSASRSSAPACRRRRTARARTSSRTPCSRFFMHNLGAYRVDRRLKHGLYKDVLKAYSCVLIERGYHSLFFPGRHALALRRRRAQAQARPRGDGHRGVRAHGGARAGRSTSSSSPRRSTTSSRSRPRRSSTTSSRRRASTGTSSRTTSRRARRASRRSCASSSGSTRAASSASAGRSTASATRSTRRASRTTRAATRSTPLTYLRRTARAASATTRRATRSTRASSARPSCAAYMRDTVVMATHLVAACAFEQLRESMPARADIFALLRHQDDVAVPRASWRSDVERLRRPREGWRRAAASSSAPRLGRAAGRRDPRRGASRLQRATTRRRCSSRAATTSSSSTRGSSSTTRTVSRPTGSPSMRSRRRARVLRISAPEPQAPGRCALRPSNPSDSRPGAG